MSRAVAGPAGLRLGLTGASLEECQRGALGAAPVALAIRIVVELAGADEDGAASPRASGAGAGGVSPALVAVGYDGSVARVEAEDPRAAAYLSPEQTIGDEVDARADVFSLGVVLWELLAGTRLFDRADEAATSLAIVQEPVLDIRAVNPDVPPLVGEVVMTALARSRTARFDHPQALARALASARAASGIGEASPQDTARWVAERVPRQTATAAASPFDAASVPDLDMPAARRPPPAAPPPVASGAIRAVAVAPDDADDMEIERNLVAAPPMPSAAGPRSHGAAYGEAPASDARGGPASRPTGNMRSMGSTGSGLELGAPTRASARSSRPPSEAQVSLGATLAGHVAALVIAGSAAAALFRFARRAGGIVVTKGLPHAFDGTSATESGAVALAALVLAVVIAFVGLRLAPHAWAVVASGGALLLLALAMVTVTLASTGDNPIPPDGVLLVPYLVPLAALLLGLGMLLRAGRRLAHGRGAAKFPAVPLAAAAGALAFAALELSRFAP